ncbi:MAG: isoprenyl transferase [Chloroherpetonaceae bacterium]|nr:isoprenyl transferase [Chloroherpetonaceae bacterium]
MNTTAKSLNPFSFRFQEKSKKENKSTSDLKGSSESFATAALEPNSPEDIHEQNALKLSGELPKHIAIIMDGNGRWAKSRGKLRVSGHSAGIDAVRDTVEACAQLGIPYLTLYAFSTENWKRPEQEISALMQLLIEALRNETKTLHDNNIKLNVIGNVFDLPSRVREKLIESQEHTKNNNRMTLSLALSYSGRWEILEAVRKIASLVESGKVKPSEITSEHIERHLATFGMPHPDLLIRTSGEFRISNFLLWQLAYTEIHFTNCYWPDFRRHKLYDAIKDFQKRERRFGMTAEQLKVSAEAATSETINPLFIKK